MSSVNLRFFSLMAASTLVLGACATTGATPEAPVDLATLDQREAAERADPLTKARFWAAEYSKEPENIETAKHFAESLRGIDSHDRVIQVVSDTLILYPADYDLLMLLGRSYLSKGKIDGAAQSFGRAISVDNSRPDAFAALGLAYDRAAQHEFAQRAYTKALEIDPNRTTTLTNLGLSLALSGNIARAEETLKKAAARPDANTQVRQNLALVLGLQGKFDEMKTVDEAAPAEIMEKNATLLKRMIHQNTPIETASTIATPTPPAPAPVAVQKVEQAPSTPVSSSGLKDVQKPLARISNPAPRPEPVPPKATVSSVPAGPKKRVPQEPKKLVPKTVTKVPETITASKRETVEAVLATASRAKIAPPEAETQTARLPGGLRGSLED